MFAKAALQPRVRSQANEKRWRLIQVNSDGQGDAYGNIGLTR
jgi:hypothetical protein